MITVSVQATTAYDVLIGEGILHTLGTQLRRVCKAETIAVISDSNVFPLYGKSVLNSLNEAGYSEIVSYVFAAGEESKNGDTYLSILEFLAQNRLTRSDCIIALGGGVVGDMTGFVAATYLRGISYVQIPTTLLAAVDSSVGGKTAIDLKAGKNLAGAFCQPKLVLCDTATLATLPPETFRDGCAEVIKYGVLYDSAMFLHLQEYGLDFYREQIISRCVELKRDVVAEDEFDHGARQKLNLGHTIGHGIETASKFSLSHGQAVATGMAIVTRAAAARSLCTEETRDNLLALLERFDLPCGTSYDAELLYRAALSDKKRRGGTVNLIVPREIGRCDIIPTPIEKLKAFIEEGL